ncbi:hypothetical protein, partial [Caulobacter sp. HMWF025]
GHYRADFPETAGAVRTFVTLQTESAVVRYAAE